MVARLTVLASLALLVAAVIAAARSGASYTKNDVVKAFSEQAYGLVDVERVRSTRGAPQVPGTFLFPEPIATAPFYVYVAPNDLFARQYYARLAPATGSAGVLDLLEGNVVLSSDASSTESGLTREERRRVRGAMALLAQGR